jgi:hypothetical protein
VLLGSFPVLSAQDGVSRDQIFIESRYRILVLAALLETPALVEDVRWVLGVEEQICQDRDALAGVTRKTGFSGRPLPRLAAGSERGVNLRQHGNGKSGQE